MDPIYAQDDKFQTDQDIRKSYGIQCIHGRSYGEAIVGCSLPKILDISISFLPKNFKNLEISISSLPKNFLKLL